MKFAGGRGVFGKDVWATGISSLLSAGWIIIFGLSSAPPKTLSDLKIEHKIILKKDVENYKIYSIFGEKKNIYNVKLARI